VSGANGVTWRAEEGPIVTGTRWDVEQVITDRRGRPRGDGDTVTLLRSRVTQLGDGRYRILDVDPQAIRLVWVDTPERGQDGYSQADADLDEWIGQRWERLTVVCYESAGWDRLLGDLIDRTTGESASQWLMVERGWPPYEATS
jgi:endonuclease YncB( thermonuclease family)